jgi:hypothetical protein
MQSLPGLLDLYGPNFMQLETPFHEFVHAPKKLSEVSVARAGRVLKI